MDGVLTMIMAGGFGERLQPLTRDRSKSAVPFGGKFRIIDFTLSNCINSGIRKIYVLTQYRSESLQQHIQEAWGISSARLGDYIYCIPPQQKSGANWYGGTADAIRQNINLVEDQDATEVLVLSGDHIYKMNYRQMMEFHRSRKCCVTVSAIRVRVEDAAGQLGVIEVDGNQRMVGFEEKPAHPKTIPGEPDFVLASMGIYAFNVGTLKECLQSTDEDFGHHIIPRLLKEKVNIFVYDYTTQNRISDYVTTVFNGKRSKQLVEKTRDSNYWRDVGTIDSYFDASMDLIGIDPIFSLYGEKWPIRTYTRWLPPSKFVLGGITLDSLVSDGCIVSGGTVRHSVLSPGVIVESGSILTDTVVFDDTIIEPGVRINRAIIDKECVILAGTSIGHDMEADKRRGFKVSSGGIVVIPKGTTVGPA